MDTPLVTVFLTVIAVTALLQAGFLAALVFGARLGTRKLALLEDAFEETVAERIRDARKLTEKAAEAAHESLLQSRRVDHLVAESSKKAERYLDRTAAQVESAVERAAERVEAEVARRARGARRHRLLRRLSNASAWIVGVQRAVEVWQASEADAAEVEAEADEEGADEEAAEPVR
ncbi:MAG TPA: hypothetical protein VMR21_13825 [Vicinamibacteria bacterium]|nr:hypothetical protein [Vicinamibacteria bacterium]